MYQKIMIAVISMMTLIAAGPNKNVRLYFDFAPNTDRIDTTGNCPPESSIVAGIRIKDASELYGYQLLIDYDTASLEFISGKRDNGQTINFLEQNDGSCLFYAKVSLHDSTKILVGSTLSGDDPNQCVSGKGVLGILTFKHKKDDTTFLSIDSTKLIGCSLVEDKAKSCYEGKILPSHSGVTYFARHTTKGIPKVDLRNGKLDITFNRKTEYAITAVNTLGRLLYTQRGTSEKIRFEKKCMGYNKGLSQLVIVKVSYTGNEIVVPMIQ